MTPGELHSRLEKNQSLHMELADSFAAVSAFASKMAMFHPTLQRMSNRADFVPSDLPPLAELMRMYRNHSDDYIRAGNLLRRIADVVDPVLEDMAKP